MFKPLTGFLFVLLLLGTVTPAFSQDEQKPDDAKETEQASAEPEAKKEGPSVLEASLDTVLGAVNKVVGTAIFFDITFGAFDQKRFADGKGNTVYAVDDQNQILDPEGNPAALPSKAVSFKEGKLVDGQGRHVLLMDRSGGVLLVADDQGRLLDAQGRTPKFFAKEGKPLAVEYKDGKLMAGGDEANVQNADNPTFENGVKYVTGKVTVPFVLAILVLGSVFFTFWYGWINIRGFKHSIDVIRGKYDDPKDKGEISHFRALTSALSATVGLGNIAGVAVAIQLGGPGAVFWMLATAVFGMTAKFSSCTLAQLFRQVNPDGSISGGPMYYIDLGLKSKGAGWGKLGKVLGIMYAFCIMGGAFGGGNMFQANQSFEALSTTFTFMQGGSWIFGLILAVLVGLVIIGGIKRIGAATSKIVPAMCGVYVLAAIVIIFMNFTQIPATLGLIFSMAFTKSAFFGGMIGVFIMGVRRAAFSNEAGLGSAAIAHAAAKTNEPVREGMVAMIGPFIDTIIVCLMTALVVIITGAWNNPDIPREAGVAMTTSAFASAIPFFQYILAICILLFAYSTMISWCYYGERGWIYLLDHFGGRGLKTVIVFRVIFVIFVFVGAVSSLGVVIEFSDIMIFAMAFPNIIGSVILAPYVLEKVKDYWSRLTSGQMKPLQ